MKRRDGSEIVQGAASSWLECGNEGLPLEVVGLVVLEMTTCLELARKDLNIFEQWSDFMTFKGFRSSEAYLFFCLGTPGELAPRQKRHDGDSRHLGISTFGNFMCLVQVV